MEATWYKIFNYGSIVLVFILAVLLGIDAVRGTFDIIPRQFYTPILIVVGVIFILRIRIRSYLNRISNK